MKALAYICMIVAVDFLLAAAGAAWLFRDGLGPESVTSSGFVAWARFWREFWVALVFAAPVLLFGLWCFRHTRVPLKNDRQ
jgi:hypothetical protein